MREIRFSDVGVVVNSLEELNEIYLTYTALGIPFIDNFKEDYENAQKEPNLVGWFIQCTNGAIETKLITSLKLSIIHYRIEHSMESLDFAIACQLLMSNQEAELKAHLAQHCKEYK